MHRVDAGRTGRCTPQGTQVEGVPTLILGGEYDLPVPEAVSQLAADVLVDATYVGLAAAGHDPQFWSACGREILQRFIDTLNPGDTSCADEPAGGWWVPGSFPKRVTQAPPAAQTGGPRASRHARRLATAAAWTVMDSVRHNFVVPNDSVALRGGIVDWEPLDNGAQWTLIDAHFTKDLAVSGTFTVTDDRPWDGEFQLNGPDGRRTTMHLTGDWFVDGANMTITLDTHGKTATFTVPAY